MMQFELFAFSVLNKLCASTMSPTQAGPSTNIFGDVDVAADIMLSAQFFDDIASAAALN